MRARLLRIVLLCAAALFTASLQAQTVTAPTQLTLGINRTTGQLCARLINGQCFEIGIQNQTTGAFSLPATHLPASVARTDTTNVFALQQTFTVPSVQTGLAGYMIARAGLPTTASSTVPTTDLSGVLQAAQSPAYSGDVASPAGSLTSTIQPSAVTAGKIASGAAATNVGTLGGDLIGTLPNPTIGTNVVGYGKMVQAPAGTLRGNPSGASANVSDNALSAYMDTAFGSTQGQLVCRGPSGWTSIAGGASGYLLTGNGALLCPTYQPASAAATPNITNFVNLKLTNGAAPATQDTVTADSVTLKGVSNGLAVANVNVTISTAAGGANGLDPGAGTIAVNTGYFVWLISNGSTTAGLLSTSATAPNMPSGYTYKMRVGWTRTDGSSALYRITQIGRRAQYVVTAGASPSAAVTLSSGAQGNITTPTYVAVSLVGFMPSTASAIFASVWLNNGTSIVAPNNSYGAYSSTTNPPPVVAGASFQLGQAFTFLLESTNIYYAAGNGALYLTGWEDNI